MLISMSTKRAAAHLSRIVYFPITFYPFLYLSIPFYTFLSRPTDKRLESGYALVIDVRQLALRPSQLTLKSSWLAPEAWLASLGGGGGRTDGYSKFSPILQGFVLYRGHFSKTGIVAPLITCRSNAQDVSEDHHFCLGPIPHRAQSPCKVSDW